MDCPADPRNEVPRDLPIDHQKAVKFCSNSDPKSAGMWVLLFLLESVQFCFAAGSTSAGLWVLQMFRLEFVKFRSNPHPRSAGMWVPQIFFLESVKSSSNPDPRSAGTWVLQTFQLKSVKCWSIADPRPAGMWGLEQRPRLGVFAPVGFRWSQALASASCKRATLQAKISASSPEQGVCHWICWSFRPRRVARALAAVSRALLAAASSCFGSATEAANFPNQGKRTRPMTWGWHGLDQGPAQLCCEHRALSHKVDLLLSTFPKYTRGTIWKEFNHIQYKHLEMLNSKATKRFWDLTGLDPIFRSDDDVTMWHNQLTAEPMNWILFCMRWRFLSEYHLKWHKYKYIYFQVLWLFTGSPCCQLV